ncbi:MAG: DUF2723 domain-containing protein [Caldilineaceae bacterium]|nr:DUF2723 domain-containing protein [Caldilineaceae bacterium]
MDGPLPNAMSPQVSAPNQRRTGGSFKRIRSWLRQHALWPSLVGLGFLFLYAMTTAPSIVELYDDSLEFQLVGPTFGIAHPTGYPLYIMLGGLWSRVLLPIGNWAWRMNLFSAVTAAATVALLFGLAQRLAAWSTPSQARTFWPGLTAALAFGLGPVWWSQATIAEVYALHNLLVATILLVALHLADQPVSSGDVAPAARRKFLLICCLFGLGLAHHRTIVLVAPGVALMVAGQRWLWRPQWLWLAGLGALLAPLFLYLFLPLRAAMGGNDLHGSYINDWAGFWHHVLAQGYTGFFSQNDLSVTRSARDWLQLWQAQLGSIGLGLGAVGLVWLLWRSQPRWPGLGIVAILLTNLIFTLTYRVGDQEVFLLPAWLCFSLLVGVGVGAATARLATWPWVRHGIAGLCTLLLWLGVSGRGEGINRSQAWAVHNYAVALAKVAFPPDSRVIALEGQATALRYMQAATDLGRQATPVIADRPAQRLAAVTESMAQGYPTYLTQEVAGIADYYSFSGEGPLVRVWPRGQAEVGPPQHALQQAFIEGTLQLTGYDFVWLDEAGGRTVRLALYWQPTMPLTKVYKLSLRLYQGDTLLLQADRYPLRLVAPTTTWLPGETIRDVHYLSPPVDAPPATHLRVILYAEADGAEAGAIDLPTPP